MARPSGAGGIEPAGPLSKCAAHDAKIHAR